MDLDEENRPFRRDEELESLSESGLKDGQAFLPDENDAVVAAENAAPVATLAEQPETKKRSPARKALSVVGNVLFVLLIAVLIALVYITLSSRSNSGDAAIGGLRMYSVMSGSMEPKMPVGSMVVSKYASVEEIKVDDIITFSTGMGNVTHRVVDIKRDGEYVAYITKGDANNTEDINPMPYANVKGVVILVIPFLGYLINFVRTGPGMLLIIIPALIIIVVELIKLIRFSKEEKAKADTGAKQ